MHVGAMHEIKSNHVMHLGNSILFFTFIYITLCLINYKLCHVSIVCVNCVGVFVINCLFTLS